MTKVTRLPNGDIEAPGSSIHNGMIDDFVQIFKVGSPMWVQWDRWLSRHEDAVGFVTVKKGEEEGKVIPINIEPKGPKGQLHTSLMVRSPRGRWVANPRAESTPMSPARLARHIAVKERIHTTSTDPQVKAKIRQEIAGLRASPGGPQSLSTSRPQEKTWQSELARMSKFAEKGGTTKIQKLREVENAARQHQLSSAGVLAARTALKKAQSVDAPLKDQLHWADIAVEKSKEHHKRANNSGSESGLKIALDDQKAIRSKLIRENYAQMDRPANQKRLSDFFDYVGKVGTTKASKRAELKKLVENNYKLEFEQPYAMLDLSDQALDNAKRKDLPLKDQIHWAEINLSEAEKAMKAEPEDRDYQTAHENAKARLQALKESSSLQSAKTKSGTFAIKPVPQTARVTVTSGDDTHVAEKSKKLFGRSMTRHDLAGLFGVHDGEGYTLSLSDKGMSFNLSDSKYSITRTITKDPDGTLHCHNDYFRIRSLSDRGGAGIKIFATQVKSLQSLGFAYIDTYAAGNYGNDSFNGYYTWPRFGYDSPIPLRLKSGLPTSLADSKNVSDLMATPGGREWWKLNGDGLPNAKFDLKNGSKSMRVLQAYLDEKGLKI